MISWHVPSWEAFATITASIIAVFAAMHVGLRQAAILSRQTEIQLASASDARLAAHEHYILAEQSFRESLLDRRITVLERFRAIWTEWSRHNKLSADGAEALRVLLHSAVLLYEDDITEDLNLALGGLLKYNRFCDRSVDDSYSEEAQRDWMEKAFEAQDVVIRSLEPLMQKMTNRTRVVGFGGVAGA